MYIFVVPKTYETVLSVHKLSARFLKFIKSSKIIRYLFSFYDLLGYNKITLVATYNCTNKKYPPIIKFHIIQNRNLSNLVRETYFGKN